MGADIDDTVIVPPQVIVPAASVDNDDTVVVSRRPTGQAAAAPIPPPPAPAPPIPPGTYAVRVGLLGEPLPLDRPCYIGRNPTLPRVIRGDVPRLVRVASRGREVSATHVEVRQLGNTVIVTDLRSTNGSIVMVPGSAPHTLRQGESMVVSPGTLVDIGDGTILQILPMQQPVADRAGRLQ